MHPFEAIQHIVRHLGFVGVMLVMIVENLGIPFPTEVGFLVASSLVAKGHATFFEAALVITLGNIVGSTLGYSIGRWGGKKTAAKLGHKKNLIEAQNRLTAWYKKYGNATIFFSRIIGYVRPWASLVAGYANVPFDSFLLWTTLGSLVFSTVSLYFTKYLIVIWIGHPEFHILISVLAVVIFFGILAIEAGRGTYAKIRNRDKDGRPETR